VAALAAPLHAPAPAGDGEAVGGGGGGVPLLLFAGEATHVKYIGTVHGAYLTGERAAERLVAALAQQAQA
jgi:monoamine oxidase